MFPEKAGSTGIMPNDLMRSRIFNCKRGIDKEMILKQRLRWFVNRNLGYRDAVLSWDCKIIKTAVDGYFFDTLNHHHHQYKHACIYTQKHIEVECLPTKQDNPGFYFILPHRGVRIRGLNPGHRSFTTCRESWFTCQDCGRGPPNLSMFPMRFQARNAGPEKNSSISDWFNPRAR